MHMELFKRGQTQSFVRKVITRADDYLTILLCPKPGPAHELRKPVRRVLFIVAAGTAAILMHLFSSPDRWIRI